VSRVLLIEDNRDYAATIRLNLEREGYDVVVAPTGLAGVEAALTADPDLIVLDLMLPGLNGFTVLQRLRDAGQQAPVLILTARGAEEEKLRGFGLGADDYVVKPVGLLELLARVRALLKRGPPGSGAPRSRHTLGDLEIDLAARTVSRAGAAVPVRPKEFELLAALLRHPGRVLSKEELLRDVWGYAPGTHSRTVDTHLAALRRHLGDDPRVPRYVVTVHRAGYRLGPG
jgi:DNA-binding response OmpR family regulator